MTGLDTLKYRLESARTVSVDRAPPVTVLSVSLECDRERTPYCDCSDAPATEAPLGPIDPADNIMPYLPNRKKRKKGR